MLPGLIGNDNVNYSSAANTIKIVKHEKMNDWGFRPTLCTCIYKLSWARRTSWRGWDKLTLPSRHSIRNSGPGVFRHATFGQRRKKLFLWNLNARSGDEPAISEFPSRQLHYTRTPAEAMEGSTSQQTQNICITLILYHVGPTSKTLGRRCTHVVQLFCICWFEGWNCLRWI